VKDFVYFASFDEVYERSKADALEALTFVQKVGEVAETEGHHPDVNFGWGYATVSLRTKKIKGLHENDFIMAAKIDRLARPPNG
jgi:4a-hydroxytetrahydrobiopterin dehydratase